MRKLLILLVLLWPAAALAADASDSALPPDTVADRVLVEKAARRLTLFAGDKLLKFYPVALGKHPVGPKRRLGDQKTPEGRYVIDRHIWRTGFHLALHISYPAPADRARAKAGGYKAGGSILIHGLPEGWWFLGHLHLRSDWTDGCIAVTDDEIEELWRAVPDGTPIEIRP